MAVGAIVWSKRVADNAGPHDRVHAESFGCAGAIDHWKALTQWSDERLLALVGASDVSVAITPNGRADAVTLLDGKKDDGTPRQCFCLPLEQRIPFADFLAHLNAQAAQQSSAEPPPRHNTAEGSGAASCHTSGARSPNGSAIIEEHVASTLGIGNDASQTSKADSHIRQRHRCSKSHDSAA